MSDVLARLSAVAGDIPLGVVEPRHLSRQISELRSIVDVIVVKLDGVIVGVSNIADRIGGLEAAREREIALAGIATPPPPRWTWRAALTAFATGFLVACTLFLRS